MTRGQATVLAAATAVMWSWPARAAVTQLDGTTLPQPTPAAEISVVTSRGFPSTADTLAGLFQTFAGGVDRGLDPIADAATGPGTFDPTCGVRISIVLKGDGCKNTLGWYNASHSATPPPANQIYTIIPADLTGAFPNGIGCADTDFCPMASRNTSSQASSHIWADPLPAFEPQIASDSRWKGGPVGFALLGNTGQCNQTKYSELDLNVASTKYGTPWVTVLVYPSAAAPGALYLAFESLPMIPADWKANGTDGDFNDDVYFVAPTPCGGRGGAAGGASGAPGGASGAPGGANGAAAGASGAPGGASGAAGGASSVAGGAGGGAGQGIGGASGTAGAPARGGSGQAGGGSGAAGQLSSTGGRVSSGGASGMAGSPASSSGGGCSCQSAGDSSAGALRWLILLAIAGGVRRRRNPR